MLPVVTCPHVPWGTWLNDFCSSPAMAQVMAWLLWEGNVGLSDEPCYSHSQARKLPSTETHWGAEMQSRAGDGPCTSAATLLP